MKDWLDTLSVKLLLESIFYPIIVVHKEIDAISLNRHRTRSLIKLAILSTIALSLIYCFYNNYAVYDFFNKIVLAFNLHAEIQSLGSNVLAIITSLHVGNYVSSVMVRSFCNFIFGDPDLYITNRRAMELEKKFLEQGNNKITQQQICEVVNFCIKNLRRQNASASLGAKPEDWQKTIEALLYDADLEHFLDQQQALRNKKRELQIKLEAIELYSNMPPSERRFSNVSSIPERIVSNLSFAPEVKIQNLPSMVETRASTPLRPIPERRNATIPALPISLPLIPKSPSGIRRNNTAITKTSAFRANETLADSDPGDFQSNASANNKFNFPEITENTPLLSQRIYPTPTQAVESVEYVVNKELEKFKKTCSKKSMLQKIQSEECLIHNCKHHLQKIELNTAEAIYPEPLILKLFLMTEEQEQELPENLSMNLLSIPEPSQSSNLRCRKIP